MEDRLHVVIHFKYIFSNKFFVNGKTTPHFEGGKVYGRRLRTCPDLSGNLSKKKEKQIAILPQIRYVDGKRIREKISSISEIKMQKIEQEIINLLTNKNTPRL